MGGPSRAWAGEKVLTRYRSSTQLARCLARFPTLPLFPIGGIDPRSLPRWVAAGCQRAAVGSAVLEAVDPQAAAAALARLLDR